MIKFVLTFVLSRDSSFLSSSVNEIVTRKKKKKKCVRRLAQFWGICSTWDQNVNNCLWWHFAISGTMRMWITVIRWTCKFLMLLFALLRISSSPMRVGNLGFGGKDVLNISSMFGFKPAKPHAIDAWRSTRIQASLPRIAVYLIALSRIQCVAHFLTARFGVKLSREMNEQQKYNENNMWTLAMWVAQRATS